MGLDLALGGLILMAAFRGWLKGFVVQAIRLGGLVASVYVAAPVREQAKPYVVAYLPTIKAELLDRILWWFSAAVSYFVLTGVASLLIAVARRPKFGIEEPKRGDQFAGFGLGIAKGVIVTSFLVAGLQKYGEPYLAKLPWVDEQSRSSYAWQWNTEYHPAARIWSATPVQHYVGHIQRMGLLAPAEKKDKEESAEGESGEPAEKAKPVQTASRTPHMALPSSNADDVPIDPEYQAAIDGIQRKLEALNAGEKN